MDASKASLSHDHNINAQIFRKQRKQFIDQFGVTLNLPGYLIQSASIYPKDLSYFLSFEHYAFPEVKIVTMKHDNANDIPDKDTLDENRGRQMIEFECALTMRKQTETQGYITVDQFNFSPIQHNMRKFKFSDSGNHLAIQCSYVGDTIHIFDSSTDIETLLSTKINGLNSTIELKNEEIKDTEKVVFSGDDKAVFIGTNQCVMIFDVQEGTLISRIAIPDAYDHILSMVVNISGTDAMILCKKSESRVTSLMQLSLINDEHAMQSIHFTSGASEELRARISDDFKSVFLNNESDNIFFDGNRQIQIPWFRDRNVLKILEIKNNQNDLFGGFLCVTARDFDNTITVLHTHDSDFKVKIDRQVTPGNYMFKDMILKDGMVKILSIRDGELFIDSFDISNISKQKIAAQTNTIKRMTYYDAPFKALEFQWPFIAYGYQSRDIILTSVHQPKIMYRFPVKNSKEENLSTICLTEKHELFYAVIYQGKFHIYRIDGLDSLDKLSSQPIKWSGIPLFSYEASSVGNEPIYQLWVKSATMRDYTKTTSSKSDARFFMLHNQSLYSCIEGEVLQFISQARHAKQIGQNNIFFDTQPEINKQAAVLPQINDKNIKLDNQYSCVWRLQILYSKFKVEKLYEETRTDSKVCNFSLDLTLNRVYVLIKKRNVLLVEYHIAVVDVNTYQVLARLDISEKPELYGPFKSGINFLINGNFYYQNSLTRLDPLNPKHTLYTRYDDLMPTQAHEQMAFANPKVSLNYKRILFIKNDRGNRALRTAFILPFLDERKVVLTLKSKIPQLWTLVDLPSNSENSNGPVAQNITDESVHLKPRLIQHQDHSISNHNFSAGDELLVNDCNDSNETQKTKFCPFWNNSQTKVGINNFASPSCLLVKETVKQQVLSINTQMNTVSTFSLQGQLQSILPLLGNGQKSFGDPLAISQNGQVMVFKNQNNLKFQVNTLDPSSNKENCSSNFRVDVEEILLNDFKTLSLLLPVFAYEYQQKKMTATINTIELNNYHTIKRGQSSDIMINDDFRISQKIKPQDQLSTTMKAQTPIQVELGTELFRTYRMKVEVNNQGDICLLFIQKKTKTIKDYFRKVLNQKLVETGNNKFNLNLSENAKKNQDGKKRVFMLILRPNQDQPLQIQKQNKRFSLLQQSKLVDDKQREVIVFSNQNEFSHVGLVKDFLLTNENLIFWNLQSVYYFCHSNAKTLLQKNGERIIQIQQISFTIPREDISRNAIQGVYAHGRLAKDRSIVIKMSLNPKLCSIIVWDLLTDIELDSYDVLNDAEVMFDAKGELYILEHDHIIMNNAGGRCFAYQLQGNSYFKNARPLGKHTSIKSEDLSRGNRFDSRNKNFMIVKNQLHLGHSYLGIFISELNALNEYSQRIFDPLAYPYYFNQQNELHHLVTDPLTMDQILTHYEINDQRLLDQILLTDKNMHTPLHLAQQREITKSLNILLKKLSIVRVNNTYNLRDIFDNFLDYQFFEEYLKVCNFQTLQMKGIQSLNIPRGNGGDSEESAIVIQHTNTFMSQELINGVTSEGSTSQPVVVKGFDLYWILNTPEGEKFLHKLSRLENVTFFTTEFIKTLIYFLWSYYKQRIIFYVMLPYAVYFSFFLAIVFYNENYFQNNVTYEDNEYSTMMGLSITLLFIIAYFYYLLMRKCLTLGWYSFRVMWVWMDFISNSLNLAVVIMTISQGTPFDIRRIESVAVILMWFRFLYFFRILDHTAPLIRMIWQILYDMRAFIFIFVVIILAFANGFYVLAKNQQNVTDDSVEISYFTFKSAILYVYLASIGEFDTSAYQIGEDESLLWAFFIFTTFLLSIVLLNMLIAMMGQSYERISEVAEASMLKERIMMIMENLFLATKGDFGKAKYLISFAPVQEVDEQEAMMETLLKKIGNLGSEMKSEIQALKDKMQNNSGAKNNNQN